MSDVNELLGRWKITLSVYKNQLVSCESGVALPNPVEG